MDDADNNEDNRSDSSDDYLSGHATDGTDINPEEYYESRLGDLAPFVPRDPIEEYFDLRQPSSDWQPWETVDTIIMADLSQPTQQATQPVEDPRRLGHHLSNISDNDAADVICILHPSSPAAFEAVRANLLFAQDHILQNHDLEGVTEDDLLFGPEFKQARDIALRISSGVQHPKDGFRFGRASQPCDILLTPYENDSLVSKVHFKIFVNSQGSLMLQDLSTNGTLVDDTRLRGKGPRGKPAQPATIALKHGTIICVVSSHDGTEREEIKFMIRIPSRGDNEDAYEENLRRYLAARGEVAQFASMRESSYGNHWNGGSLYNFTGLLGKGAFATVYRVQTKKEGDIYAAKELDKRRFIKNGVLDTKFDSELNIMKNLKHPNIVNYVDCHSYSHWIYILMEYVPYGELSQDLRRLGKIPEPDVQQITRQILHALDYLHRRNITHRDIKPDNILIASRSPLIVKLSDFGLSKCVTDQETFLKTFCGTLLYCAPEVYPDYEDYARGGLPKRRRLGEPVRKPVPSPYDQSVDMWSFGAVLFHMLCGKPPITGRGDDRGAQMLNNIMTKAVDFSPLRQNNVSAAAIDLIGKLLNRNPALRPKESECLQHPWLRDVPDNCLYDGVEDDGEAFSQQLDMIDEVDELDEDLLDEELISHLNQLTQPPLSSQSPDRPAKRARTATRTSPPSREVAYPPLPDLSPSVPAARLFGEITPSVLRSSGLFGAELPPTTVADVHNIQNRVEQISVNDFARPEETASAKAADISGQPFQYPQVVDARQAQATSAESLLGAEQQIGQLNMASPDADISDAATPETTNPVTPQTRELSPSSGITQHLDTGRAAPREIVEEPVFTRRVDLGLISDPDQFDAEIEARNASRAEKLRAKADTFHGNGNAKFQLPSIELAVTIDERTGQEIKGMEDMGRFIRPARASELDSAATPFVRPSKRFGKLSSVPGSFANVTVNLEGRLTSWGRGVDCTVRHADVKDTRIPLYAVKIIFWAPGMERHVEQGGDWTGVSGVRTVLSTSASGCIWVNDVELRKESRTGDAALFGKLYTGDIITIFDDQKGHFLKFCVEITFGDSARNRPAKEAGFVVQEERQHHQRMKERESMKMSRVGSEPVEVI